MASFIASGAGDVITRKTTVKDPTCAFCGKAVTEDEHCSGCGVYVCSNCDKNAELMGAHKPSEHRVDPDESADDLDDEEQEEEET